jgi:hypothetical protein
MNDAVPNNDTIPRFFFSYSRADGGNYLDKFFEDLRFEVGDLLGEGIERANARTEAAKLAKIGFRDREGVKTGEEWKKKIAAAMQHAGVLVCVYSANFFSPRRLHEFCGREFEAFLQRLPDAFYTPFGPGRFQLEGYDNILAVLWVSHLDLTNGRLPPPVLRQITWALDKAEEDADLNGEYLRKGMQRIAMRRSGTYLDIVRYLARRIVEFEPLRPGESVADIEKLRNAFWDDPDPKKIRGDQPAAPGPNGAATAASPALPILGPKHLLAIEVTAGLVDAPDWTPYAGECSVASLVEEIANEQRFEYERMKLDAGAADFVARMSNALAGAKADSSRLVIVVDPHCLARVDWQAVLTELLQAEWYVGLVVPVDRTDQLSVSLVERVAPTLQPPPAAQERVVVRISIGTLAEFRTALVSVAAEVLSRIVTTADVPRPHPEKNGFATRPRIANTLNPARGM